MAMRFAFAFAAALLLAPPALAQNTDAPLWPSGCDGCNTIEPPAYMVDPLAAFERGRAAASLAIVGPRCRQLGPNYVRGSDWQSCRFGTTSGCTLGELRGRRGSLALIDLSGIARGSGCSEEELRSFQRVGVEAFLRCRDEASRRRSADILLNGTVVELASEGQDRARRPGRPSGQAENIQIHSVCVSMVGTRSLEPAPGGARETIGLMVDDLPN